MNKLQIEILEQIRQERMDANPDCHDWPTAYSFAEFQEADRRLAIHQQSQQIKRRNLPFWVPKDVEL
ncbi:MAG: hypothetical protein U0941_17795 [Planctomycetaceae bacterium]